MKCLWRETSLVRSVLEYAAPVWAGLPSYLSDLVKSVQKEALRIIFLTPKLLPGAGLRGSANTVRAPQSDQLYPGSICVTFSMSGKPASRTNKRQPWIWSSVKFY